MLSASGEAASVGAASLSGSLPSDTLGDEHAAKSSARKQVSLFMDTPDQASRCCRA
jgi:hypothetical protein